MRVLNLRVPDSLKGTLEALVGRRLYEAGYSWEWARRLRRGYQDRDRHISLVDRFVETGGVCVDVGAHGGAYTYPMSRVVGPTGVVLAFEPCPRYARILDGALKRLNVHNVQLHRAALSDREGKMPFVYRTTEGRLLHGRSHLAGSAENAPMAIDVPVTTLDTVAGRFGFVDRVGFMKIDVEGAELFVLRGARRVLEKSRPVVLCEVADEGCARYGHTSTAVFDYMANLGLGVFAWDQAMDCLVPQAPEQRRGDVFFIHESSLYGNATGHG